MKIWKCLKIEFDIGLRWTCCQRASAIRCKFRLGKHAVVILIQIKIDSIHPECGWSREPIVFLHLFRQVFVPQLKQIVKKGARQHVLNLDPIHDPNLFFEKFENVWLYFEKLNFDKMFRSCSCQFGAGPRRKKTFEQRYKRKRNRRTARVRKAAAV